MKQQFVKEVRITLDSIQKALNDLPKSRYSSLAVTRVEAGRLWLGKVLQALGTPYPYPTGSDMSTKKIDLPVDLADGKFPLDSNVIMACKGAREVLGNIIDSIDSTLVGVFTDGESGHLALFNSISAIQECRMWLGMLMQESSKAPAPTKTSTVKVEKSSTKSPSVEDLLKKK